MPQSHESTRSAYRKAPPDVAVFPCDEKMRPLFFKELMLCKNPNSVDAEKKAALFDLLSDLGRKAEREENAFSTECGNFLPKQTTNNQSKFESIRIGYEYLNEHFESETSIEELASLCYVSPVWFRKIFKAYTGFSPVEYRKNLRLTQAERYLKYGNMSVSEIAESVGYNDASLFIRHFKNHYGLTPLSLRKGR